MSEALSKSQQDMLEGFRGTYRTFMVMRVLLAARRSITGGAMVAVRDYRSIESHPPPPPLAQGSGGGRWSYLGRIPSKG